MSHTRTPERTRRLQRSELAVPGSNPGMFEKAAASNVDYVFLDLEDAVAPDDKIAARSNIIQALNDIDWRGQVRQSQSESTASILTICTATSSRLLSRRVSSLTPF